MTNEEKAISVKSRWKRKKLRVPVVIQMEAVECGAASLGMILAYYGCFVPLEKLRIDCGVSRDGCNAANIVKAGEKYNLDLYGISGEIEALHQHDLPVILFWSFCHFVVLTGRKGNKFFINDPASGPRIEEMDSSFTGVFIAGKPSSDKFQKSGKAHSLVKNLWMRTSGSRAAIIFAVLAGLLMVLPSIAISGFQRVFVDNVIVDSAIEWIFPLLSVMLVTALVMAFLQWIKGYYLLITTLKLAITSSAKFLYHTLRLPMQFFTQRFPGEIGNRIHLNDTVASLLSDHLADNMLNLSLLGFYVAILFLLDWALAVVTITFAAINLTVLSLVSKKRKVLSANLQQSRGKFVGTTMEGIQLIENLKATGAEEEFFAGWSGQMTKNVNVGMEVGFISLMINSVPALLESFNTIAILSLGSLRIIGGYITIGILMAYQIIAGMFNQPINTVLNFSKLFQEIDADINRLNDVLNYKPDPIYDNSADAAEDSIQSEKVKLDGYLELKNIKFGYSEVKPPFIENFSLKLNPGDRVALVGSTGSGKSTIAKIVTGLYAPWEGEVLFDNKTRDTYSRGVFNNSVSIVDQSVFLFEGTVKDNLTMWDTTIETASIMKAAKDAAIHENITSRPGAYNGKVAENGSNFSGGQRQRLEIARALAKNPSLLILDEATSALDAETERAIDLNIRRRRCACLIIAHRLSTVRDCSEIIVMDHGKIVERGTHQELIDRKGTYLKLIKDQ